MASDIWVNSGSVNGMVPNRRLVITLMLIYDQSDYQEQISMQFWLKYLIFFK